MLEFTAECIGEAANREFRSAIGRLQWNCAVAQGRSYLHDRARIAAAHVLKRRHGSEDVAQISNLRESGGILPETCRTLERTWSTAILKARGVFKNQPKRAKDREGETIVTAPLGDPPEHLVRPRAERDCNQGMVFSVT